MASPSDQLKNVASTPQVAVPTGFTEQFKDHLETLKGNSQLTSQAQDYLYAMSSALEHVGLVISKTALSTAADPWKAEVTGLPLDRTAMVKLKSDMDLSDAQLKGLASPNKYVAEIKKLDDSDDFTAQFAKVAVELSGLGRRLQSVTAMPVSQNGRVNTNQQPASIGV